MNTLAWLLIILAIIVLLVWGLGAAVKVVFWVVIIGLVLIGIWYLLNRNRMVTVPQ